MTTADRLHALIEKATKEPYKLILGPDTKRPHEIYPLTTWGGLRAKASCETAARARLIIALANVAPQIAAVLSAAPANVATAREVHTNGDCVFCAIGALESALAKELDRG